MKKNRYLVILNAKVVQIVEGEYFESSGYDGVFLKDYDTVVQDNDSKLSKGDAYSLEAFSLPPSLTEDAFENAFGTAASGDIPVATFE